MDGTVVGLDDVTVTYDGHNVLDGIDLEISAGERVAVVGPSGAGKSTLLGLCNGTVAAASGRVRVLGRDLAQLRPGELRSLRRRIATVHQQLHLVPSLRVVHNVNAGRLAGWSLARALRSLVHPADVKADTALLDLLGLADRLMDRTDELSGGEQQRVALARALAQGPELLLADEPVSSLDPGRRQGVMDLLTTAPGTLLVSLHDFDVARSRCDRVLGLRDGRLVFDLPAGDVSGTLGAELYRIRA